MGNQLEEIPDGLTLFVALTPNQFLQLCCEQPVVSDPYSGRFGLRANQLTAVQRAHEFMNWRQDGRDPGNDGHVQQKKFVVCTLKITPLWYFALMEAGTLQKGDGSNHYRDGYFRWNGRSSKRELSSIKVPTKYSSESWISSWKLYKSLLEFQFAF